MSERTLRPPAAAQTEVRGIYILVMGLTGAGKSTFISVVTGNTKIPIGEPEDMDGGKHSDRKLDAQAKCNVCSDRHR